MPVKDGGRISLFVSSFFIFFWGGRRPFKSHARKRAQSRRSAPWLAPSGSSIGAAEHAPVEPRGVAGPAQHAAAHGLRHGVHVAAGHPASISRLGKESLDLSRSESLEKAGKGAGPARGGGPGKGGEVNLRGKSAVPDPE